MVVFSIVILVFHGVDSSICILKKEAILDRRNDNS